MGDEPMNSEEFTMLLVVSFLVIILMILIPFFKVYHSGMVTMPTNMLSIIMTRYPNEECVVSLTAIARITGEHLTECQYPIDYNYALGWCKANDWEGCTLKALWG